MFHLTNIIMEEEKEIELMIDNYIGDHLETKDVSRIGNLVYVRLTYKNFLPEREVRDKIESMVPLCKVERIERIYTEDVIRDTLMQMYKEGATTGGGDVPLFALVEERLFTKAI